MKAEAESVEAVGDGADATKGFRVGYDDGGKRCAAFVLHRLESVAPGGAVIVPNGGGDIMIWHIADIFR